jgi:hypothetical protein
MMRSFVFSGIKALLGRRDVIVCARQQIGGASDIVKIKPPTKPDELPLREPVLLEQLLDHLEIPTPW